MTAGRQSVTEAKDWCTPPTLVEAVKRVFRGEIDLDPCSNPHSVVQARVSYSLPEHDGLSESWDFERIYVNPPYGSDKERGTRILDWFVRIGDAVAAGSEVIALVPVATNTRHWKNFVYPAATAICFLFEPRVKFYISGRQDNKGAPMSCAVIYYGRDLDAFAEAFRTYGAVIPLEGVLLPNTLPALF
jgi:hypothetical protein